MEHVFFSHQLFIKSRSSALWSIFSPICHQTPWFGDMNNNPRALFVNNKAIKAKEGSRLSVRLTETFRPEIATPFIFAWALQKIIVG